MSHPTGAECGRGGVRSPQPNRKLPMTSILRTLAYAAVGASLAGTAAAQMRDLAPVTDAMILNPPPADWLSWRRTLNQWGFSPLDQINQKNVAQLRLVWT